MAGNDLYDQAMTKTGAEADRLFDKAYEKFQAALALKPDMHEALANWGVSIMEQAKTKRGKEAEALYRSASEKFFQAEALSPGNTAYNQACLAALQRREDEAKSWLLKAREAGQLPDRTHLEQDADLDNIRGAEWFQKLVAEL